MRKIILGIVLLGLLLTSFGSKNLKNDIRDIWVGDYHLTFYFDTIESTHWPLPMLLDLTDSNHATVKFFAEKEQKTSWSMHDSILIIDSTNYRIISITKDSIVFSPNLQEKVKPKDESITDGMYATPVKDEYYIFKRKKTNKIKYTDEDIKRILNNSLYHKSTFDSTSLNPGDWIEFLDNGVAIFKYLDDSKNIRLQEECWKIENYKGYPFLVFYQNWQQGNGFMTHAYQISKLSECDFTLEAYMKSGASNFKLQNVVKMKTTLTKMLGRWKSFNDSSNIDKQLLRFNEDRYIFYNDTLVYEFFEDSLLITGKGIVPINCKWRLSSDGTVLIYEYLIDTEDFKGFHVEYSYFYNFTNDSFDLDLYNYNYIEAENDKSKMIILNSNQRFYKDK